MCESVYAGAGVHCCLSRPVSSAAGNYDWTRMRKRRRRTMSWRCFQCWLLRQAAPGCSIGWPPRESVVGQTGQAELRCHRGRWVWRWSHRCCRTGSNPLHHPPRLVHRHRPPWVRIWQWSPHLQSSHTPGTSGASAPQHTSCHVASWTYGRTSPLLRKKCILADRQKYHRCLLYTMTGSCDPQCIWWYILFTLISMNEISCLCKVKLNICWGLTSVSYPVSKAVCSVYIKIFLPDRFLLPPYPQVLYVPVPISSLPDDSLHTAFVCSRQPREGGNKWQALFRQLTGNIDTEGFKFSWYQLYLKGTPTTGQRCRNSMTQIPVCEL